MGTLAALEYLGTQQRLAGGLRMDIKAFEEAVARLKQVEEVVGKLSPEVRSQAFGLLAPYVSAPIGRSKSRGDGDNDTDSGGDDSQGDASDKGGFFAKFSHDKPADNVRLLSAYLYNEYGSEAFATEEIKELATEVGITIPDRPDATLRVAKEGGKTLYVAAGRGKFRPTVHGEAYLKGTYSVRKGTKKRPPAE